MNLQTRFQRLWDRCRIDKGDATSPTHGIGRSDSVCRELIDHYNEPHRFYHTTGHIQKCLDQLDLAAHEMGDPEAVEMAIWFHDAIYEMDGSENELKSADYFQRCSDQVMTPEFQQKVFEMILTTIHDRTIPQDDARYVVDVDLSSLGSAWDGFREDSDAIRKEKINLSDKEFFAIQCPFLQSLLNRPRIFFTDFYRDLYESRARANIQRQLDTCR
ncbi:hypothetical protein ACFL17_05665 [Pseudomonadota bacterium]